MDTIAKLHQLCFPHKPWTANDFTDLKNSGCEIIASQNGFIVYRVTLDEAEIISIGVHPDARNTGIASAMIGIVLSELKKSGVKTVFLEVAKDNTPALRLYKSNNFVQIGVRPKYYDGTDAVLMKKEL